MLKKFMNREHRVTKGLNLTPKFEENIISYQYVDH